MNAWFPKINADGEIASGNDGVWLTDASGSKPISAVGTGPIWIGDALVFNRNDGTTNVDGYVLDAAFNDYRGSEDTRWAGFVGGSEGRVFLYDGHVATGEIAQGCDPRFGGRHFGYLEPYQSNYRALVLDGAIVSEGLIMDWQICRNGEFYVTMIATGTYTRQILNQSGGVISIRDDEAPLAVFVGPDGQNWMMTGTQVGTFVRPVLSAFGYLIEGDLYYPDCRVIEGRLRVVGSDAHGVARFNIWIDFATPRQDLRLVGVVPPDVPPVHPPNPPDPPFRPPVVPPLPPVNPFPPYISPIEVSMTPYSVAAIGPNGLYASVDPSTNLLTFDKTVVGAWETFTLEKPDDRGRLQLTSQSVPSMIIGEDTTKYGSNDVRKLFYMLDAAKRGNYESFFVGHTPNGLVVAMIEYIDQGVQTKPYASPNLTLVQL